MRLFVLMLSFGAVLGNTAFAESFSSRVRVYLPESCEPLLANYQQLVQHESVVVFYGRKLPFFEFSNFFRAPIQLRGKMWPTSEHYFQAMKFEGTSHEEAIRNTPEPRDIAAMGRDRSKPLRPDWETVKDRVMLEAVYAKFTQHPELREILLSTGDKILIEHTENDRYWGDNLDGKGSNKLGIILMVVRDVLRNERANPQLSIPEFMYIKFLAEESGYRVALTGNTYVGDSRHYDMSALNRSLKDPLSTESRLQLAYRIGSRDSLLKSVPWEMRDDETTYNEVRFSLSHADGKSVTLEERDAFEEFVYAGLARKRVAAPTDPASSDVVFSFYERDIEQEKSHQPSLITNGLKRAEDSASGPSDSHTLSFKIGNVSGRASAIVSGLAENQTVELHLNEDGSKIISIRVGDFVIPEDHIFEEGRMGSVNVMAYVSDRVALRFDFPVAQNRPGLKIPVFDANQPMIPLFEMVRE